MCCAITPERCELDRTETHDQRGARSGPASRRPELDATARRPLRAAAPRHLLGALFRRLAAVPSPGGAAASFEATVVVAGEARTFTAGDAVHAYGQALLAVLTDLRGDPA